MEHEESRIYTLVYNKIIEEVAKAKSDFEPAGSAEVARAVTEFFEVSDFKVDLLESPLLVGPEVYDSPIMNDVLRSFIPAEFTEFVALWSKMWKATEAWAMRRSSFLNEVYQGLEETELYNQILPMILESALPPIVNNGIRGMAGSLGLKRDVVDEAISSLHGDSMYSGALSSSIDIHRAISDCYAQFGAFMKFSKLKAPLLLCGCLNSRQCIFTTAMISLFSMANEYHNLFEELVSDDPYRLSHTVHDMKASGAFHPNGKFYAYVKSQKPFFEEVLNG